MAPRPLLWFRIRSLSIATQALHVVNIVSIDLEFRRLLGATIGVHELRESRAKDPTLSPPTNWLIHCKGPRVKLERRQEETMSSVTQRYAVDDIRVHA